MCQLPSGRWPQHCKARSTSERSSQTSTEAQLISTIVPPAVNMTLPGVFEDILQEGPDFVFFCSFQNHVKYAKCVHILTPASPKIAQWRAMPAFRAMMLSVLTLLRIGMCCAPTKSQRLSPTSQLPLPLPLRTPAQVVSSGWYPSSEYQGVQTNYPTLP